MVWTDADLAAIRTAMATGVRSITFADGRRTEYQTLDHMVAAESVIAAALKVQAQAGTQLVRRRVPYFRSGL